MYFFRNRMSHPGKLEKSRVTQRRTATTNRIAMIDSCQLSGPNSLYCSVSTEFSFVLDSISFASDFLQRKNLKCISCITTKNPRRRTAHPLRLYKICSQNQQSTSMMRPMGMAKRRKLANEICSRVLPLE